MRSTRGIPLRLAKLEVGAVVEDPVAFTELRMVFQNPEPRALDAELEIELPAGARVTRFASRDGDGWHEAEVVKRRPLATRKSLKLPTAPQVSDGVDAKVFRASIPNIEGRSRQEVVISYAEAFDRSGSEYRVRLAGLPKVGKLDANVLVTVTSDDRETAADERGTKRNVELHHAGVRPREDLVVQLPREKRVGIRHKQMVVARVNPVSHDHAEPIHGLTILFDTSASRAVGFGDQVARLDALLDSLERFVGPQLPIRLVAFDQVYTPVYEGRIGDLSPADLQALRERAPMGASNLRAAIDYVGLRHQVGFNRVLLVSDGVATAGQTEVAGLEQAVKALGKVGVVRFDVITDGTLADRPVLTRLARALNRHGLVLDAVDDPEALTRRLVRTVTDDVRIDVPGARWSYPERVDGIQSTDEVLVFAEIEDPGTLEVHCNSAHDRDLVREVPLTVVEPHLVENAWMAGQVASLADTLRRQAASMPLIYRRKAWARIVELSTEHRILNDWTTLEVASRSEVHNTDSDILVTGPLGVQILQRDVVVDEAGAGRLPGVPRLPADPLGVDELLLLADAEPAPAPTPKLGPGVDPADQQRQILEALHRDVQHSLPEQLPEPAEPPRVVRRAPARGHVEFGPPRPPSDAYSGNLLAVMNLLDWGRIDEATQMASAWREAEPASVMALVALGESLERSDRQLQASRVYGSIIDLFPDRADMRRFAGQRLERLGPVGKNLALDTYQAARVQRPEHPSSHRLYAFALLRAGEPERAFEVMAGALLYGYREEEFGPIEKVIREDLGLIAASWIKQVPGDRTRALARLRQLGAVLPTRPSLRFVLTWETSGNDVDLHVRDRDGEHASYESPVLESGGMLYGDVKEGFGPEEFAISGEPRGYPYAFQVHYYAPGPLGYGMGKLEIIEHDGDGGLAFDERPFVVTRDRAYVDLGVLEGPLGE